MNQRDKVRCKKMAKEFKQAMKEKSETYIVLSEAQAGALQVIVPDVTLHRLGRRKYRIDIEDMEGIPERIHEWLLAHPELTRINMASEK